jgi:nitrogen fixation NifU-like protein
VSADLDALYQRAILDHHRQPRNVRVIGGARTGERDNPLCGDRVVVYLAVEDGVIADAAFQATGCAIARASASLMTESVKGKTVEEVRALAGRLERMLTAPPGAPIDDLGPLTALAGVRQFPMRVKCATLAWQALDDACYNRPASR